MTTYASSSPVDGYEPRPTGLRAFVAVFTRHWAVIAVTTVLVAGTLFGVSFLLPKQYEAQSQLFVSVDAGSDVSSLTQGGDFSQQRIQSYIGLVTSRPVMEAVISELSLDTTPEALAEHVRAEAAPETVLLDIYATDEDPEQAAAITNSVTEHVMTEVTELETPADGSSPVVTLSLVEDAAVPTDPIAPDPVRNTAFGLVLGFLLGCLLAYARVALDTRIREPRDAATAAGTSLLVRVPDDAASAADVHHMTSRSPTAFAESLRLLRTRLRFADVDEPVRAVSVTSVSAGEGKSTLAIHLAAALAESGLTVLLVDADLRRPTIAHALGLESAVGLTTVLTRRASLSDAVQRASGEGFDVLTSGVLPPNPSEVLESDSMRKLVSEVRAAYDFVILDSSPAGATADAAILGTVTDGFLFVVRCDAETKREVVHRVHHELVAVGARGLGVLANKCRNDDVRSSEYYK